MRLRAPARAIALALLGGVVCLIAACPVRANGVATDSLSLATATQLRRLAIQIGDSTRAPYAPGYPDTLWSRVLAMSTPWQWEALAHLVARRLAVPDLAGADSLLAHASVSAWPVEDRAARLALGASLRAAMGDTSAALASCRQAMRAFPTSLGARAALALFDTLSAAVRDSVRAADDALAAEVAFWAGDRPAAIARLERAFRSNEASENWRLGVRLAEIQRLARRRSAARATLDRCVRLAPDSSARARVWLERARVLRDEGTPASAYVAYGRAAALAAGSSTAEAAEWEVAREAEEQADAGRAAAAYRRVERLGLKRAGEARVRRGLVALDQGNAGAARECFAGAPGEAARFWWAVAAGESSASARLAAFDSLSRAPGYSFYRAAARESLGCAGWPDGLSPGVPELSGGAALSFMSSLIDAGNSEDARTLLDRWAADDPRAGAPGDGVIRHPLELLYASALEARAGRPREGVRIAQRACEALADSSAPLPWIGWPLVYPAPPASLRDSALTAAAGPGVEPALLLALIWKESHFDSGAVSRSGAIGLTQLMPQTASLLARSLGDPPPTDSSLALPAVNLRYGARHLASLIDHFGGRLTLALAAYNAGTRAAERWRGLSRRGGEAMVCERIAYAETQDYVKGILTARAAYREFGPGRAGAPGAAR